MAKLIPSLSDCLSNNMTVGEERVAKVLMHHLKDDSWVWYNPSIPPENLEADFIILDPGRGLLILEVKDWRLDTIQQATPNSVTLLTNDGVSEKKNPFKQVKSYGHAVSQRLQKMPNLVHSQKDSLSGKLLLPYVVAVVFTNVIRSELETRDWVETFGSRSVFCKDDLAKNIDSETFCQRLWSPRLFQLQSRLTDKQVNSICHILRLEKPPVEQVREPENQREPRESLEKIVTQTSISESHSSQLPHQLNSQNNKSKPNKLLERVPTQVATELHSPQISYGLDNHNELSSLSEHETTHIGRFELGSSQLPKRSEPSPVEVSSPNPPSTIPPSRSPWKAPVIPVWAKIGSALLVFSVIGLITKSVPYFQKPKLQASSLTIGTLGSPEYQAALADYMRNKFVPADFWEFIQGKQIKVVIDGDKTLPYQEAERRIANKEWDIAFTLSPVVSIAAKDSGYAFAAQMFPGSERYQSALFVRADSPIKTIDDIKPTTVIALGGFNSASSFYMPSYDLFGKSLTVDVGHRGQEILEMVKTGKADIGAAAVGDTVKTNGPSVRIIHLSRDIPSSGVYLSPSLTESDREVVKKVLLMAPQDIQKKANYGSGQEADYSFFRGIASRVEDILICSDFTKKSVDFFCPANYKPITLMGKVNGWSHRANAYVLNVREQSGKNYYVIVSGQLLAEAIGNSDPLAIQDKEIQVKTGMPPQRLVDGNFELKLNQARQITVLNTFKTADGR